MYNWEIHGTAAWMQGGSGHNEYDFRRTTGSMLCFGINALESRGFLMTKVSRHILSVGPSRSAKGASFIIPNLSLYEGSVIVTDPKGENAYLTADKRRQKGQKVFIIDGFGEVNRRYGNQTGIRELTTNFNPLDILDPKKESYSDTLTFITSVLIVNQGKDPFWDDAARGLFAGMIAYVVEKDGVEPTLPMARAILQRKFKEIIDVAIDAQGMGEDSMARRKLARFANLSFVDNKEFQGIVSTALTQTDFLDSVSLSKHLSSTSSDFSFDKLVDDMENSTIYLVIPVDKMQTHARWLRLLVSLAFRAVFRKTNKTRHPVLFLLDELGSLGHLPVLSEAYSLAAGMNMTIWGFVQDLVQLKKHYPDDWESFISNSDYVTFFGTMCDFTASYVSKRLGKQTVEKRELQLTVPSFPNNPWLTNPFDMFGQLYARDLLQPDEIGRLPERYGVMLRLGAPVLFEQLRYYEHPNLFGHTRVDPYN